MTNNITIYPYTWTGTGLYKTVKKKDDESLEKLCPFITINKRFLDPLSGDESLEITDGEEVVKEHASILNVKNIQKLVEKGFTLNPMKTSEISYALQLMRDTLPKVIEYPSVGCIVTKTGEQFILLQETFATDNFQGLRPITSSKININAKGTLDEWIKMFQNEVLGTPLLELATAVGISGLINSYLFNNGVTHINSLLFHFVGDSSSGKTTSAMLALSTSGSPEKGEHGLLKSWLATQNGIVQSLNDNFGVPFAFDELSMSDTSKMTSLIYSITEGVEKSRLNQDGTLKSVRRWNTVIISTGEFSLLNNPNTDKNNGLNVRVIELNGTWTKSAANSDEIKRVVKSNYGHILANVANKLINNDIEVLSESFNSHKNWFKEALKEDRSNTGTRMLDTYTVIMLSVKFLESILQEENLGMKLKTDDIRQILVDYHWNTVTNRAMHEKALDAIVQFVATNRSKFSTGKKLKGYPDNYGLINLVSSDNANTQSFIRVDILKNTFSKLIQEAKFQDSSVVIKALKEAGYLIINEKDRNVNRKKTTDDEGNISTQLFYSIRIDQSHAELLGLETHENVNANISKASNKVQGTDDLINSDINKPLNKYVQTDMFEGL